MLNSIWGGLWAILKVILGIRIARFEDFLVLKDGQDLRVVQSEMHLFGPTEERVQNSLGSIIYFRTDHSDGSVRETFDVVLWGGKGNLTLTFANRRLIVAGKNMVRLMLPLPAPQLTVVYQIRTMLDEMLHQVGIETA